MHSIKISKIVQQQWKKMSADEKAQYLNQSNENRAAYEKEKHEFEVNRHEKAKEQGRCSTDEIQVISAVKARREIKAQEKEAKVRAEEEEQERLRKAQEEYIQKKKLMQV